MPHIIIEHSSNILEEVSLDEMGKSIHTIFLEVSETFKLSTLRTRLLQDDYYMADGADKHCFVHVIVELLAGRANDIKQGLIDKIILYLNSSFSKSIVEKNCLISVELREIDPKMFKYATPPLA